MPQASNELREKMIQRFGTKEDPGIPDAWVIFSWLKKKGWKEHPTRNGYIKAPYASVDAIPDEEFDCLIYLIHEWDFAVCPFERELSS